MDKVQTLVDIYRLPRNNRGRVKLRWEIASTKEEKSVTKADFASLQTLCRAEGSNLYYSLGSLDTRYPGEWKFEVEGWGDYVPILVVRVV